MTKRTTVSIKKNRTFPQCYLDVFVKSKLGYKEIAQKLGMSLSRFSGLLNGYTRMDHKEYRLIKEFCNAAQENAEESQAIGQQANG